MAATTRLRQPLQLAVASASVAVVVLYRVILWRARTRAKKTVDRMEEILQDGGPLVRSMYRRKNAIPPRRIW